ncbi:alpha-galactosidase [Saonia flava]|uniref:Alpha-galactosidase n=1 Tax=Saonia flava TaxID=523696 RepID=A0A846R2G4_9FLAO|nr:glycoside hydrolase family 27 protein [Saonia flava]NJB72135.1 alpha-galactosidase [Saonia flava]
MRKLTFLLFILLINVLQSQKFDNLAQTPPMGWNSWNTFATDINEELVKDIADAFIDLGLKDAGYEYIVLDDGWSTRERGENGELIADPKKFPSGMKALADYIHSKGLKFGLYNCAGSKTCAGYPGSRGHEYQDAKTYASWDVDYLKYDWCNTGKLNAEEAYITMRDGLKAAKRPVVFSICEWGDNEPWKWGKDVGHLWRVTGDITPCWDCELGHGNWSSWGIWKIINMRKGIREASGPGHWNDFDMMEVGNGMTQGEDRVHFGMWALFASPLIMGNDLRAASKETLEILTNKEVISVNQDPLGIQGFRFMNENDIEIWIKPLANDGWAINFVNMSESKKELNYDWKKEHIGDNTVNRNLEVDKFTYEIRDLFKKQDLGTTKNNLKATIEGHDILMVKLKKK